ncbi:hypothetical protein RRG08_044152, partial [Elysia crispata]
KNGSHTRKLIIYREIVLKNFISSSFRYSVQEIPC